MNPALLETTAQVVDASTILDIVSAVTSTFSVGQIVAMISGIIGAGIVFVFLWWGVRKAFKAIMGAVTKGRIRI